MDDEYDGYEEDGGGRCGPCTARAGGLLLLGLGLALGWMGADLLTGGAVTRIAFGGRRVTAGAGPDEGDQPDEADEADEAEAAGVEH